MAIQTMEKILHELCSLPTAPFAEGRVAAYVEAFVARRPRLKLRRDRFGNVLIELPGRVRSRQPRWVFAAHMDHPGMLARRMIDARTLEADFHGGVLREYAAGAKVRFFDGQEQVRGRIESAIAGRDGRYTKRVTVRMSRPVPAGALGMFDQGEGRARGRRFYSRVCDNLAGAAAALGMLEALHRRPPIAPVAVLLTRGEEAGFVGAIAACLHPTLLKKTDRMVIIECSAQQPYAPQGEGAIIRVGDRTSIFNSDLTYFITQQAGQLALKDESFRYQRALMPGGTCEATVYDVYGFVASSICIALGNYHNMTPVRGKIGPEYVDLQDWRNMLRLFVHLARSAHRFKQGHELLKSRLEQRFSENVDLLRPGL
jgi:putative aminopeptidase FrvX